MVPLPFDLVLEPISTAESGEPHFAMTVDADAPTQTILFPLWQRIHEGSAKTVLIPKKQKSIKADNNSFLFFFIFAPFIKNNSMLKIILPCFTASIC